MLTGPAGAGTSALATHFLTANHTEFTDGILHADLAGPPGTLPTDTGRVLDGWLRLGWWRPGHRQGDTAP